MPSTPEARRAAYAANKIHIQALRLTSNMRKLAKGEPARISSDATLEKHGMLSDDNKNIILKSRIRVKTTISRPIVEEPEEPEEPEFDPSTLTVTAKDIKSWVVSVLANTKQDNGKIRASGVIKLYAKLVHDMFELYDQTYDENRDISLWFSMKTLELLKSHKTWATSTQALWAGRFAHVAAVYPKLKLSVNVIDSFNAVVKHLKDLADAKSLLRKSNEVLFDWPTIRRETLKYYSYPQKATFEALIVLLYNTLHCRDDLNCIMAYKPSDAVSDADDPNNYMLLDRVAKTSVLYLNKYKTNGVYKAQRFAMPIDVTDLIIKLHPTDTRGRLFKFTTQAKIGPFVSKTFARVPLFAKENITIRYIRRSIVSSAMMSITSKDQATRAKRMVEIAEKTQHSVGTQSRYVTRLKDANGKEYDVVVPQKVIPKPRVVPNAGRQANKIHDAQPIEPRQSFHKPPTKVIPKPRAMPEPTRFQRLIDETRRDA